MKRSPPLASSASQVSRLALSLPSIPTYPGIQITSVGRCRCLDCLTVTFGKLSALKYPAGFRQICKYDTFICDDWGEVNFLNDAGKLSPLWFRLLDGVRVSDRMVVIGNSYGCCAVVDGSINVQVCVGVGSLNVLAVVRNVLFSAFFVSLGVGPCALVWDLL